MTSRFDLWLLFLQQRDEAIVSLAVLAILVAANWCMFSRWPILRQWMLYGGLGLYATVIFLMGV